MEAASGLPAQNAVENDRMAPCLGGGWGQAFMSTLRTNHHHSDLGVRSILCKGPSLFAMDCGACLSGWGLGDAFEVASEAFLASRMLCGLIARATQRGSWLFGSFRGTSSGYCDRSCCLSELCARLCLGSPQKAHVVSTYTEASSLFLSFRDLEMRL